MNTDQFKLTTVKPKPRRQATGTAFDRLFETFTKEFPSDLRPFDWLNSPQYPDSNYPPTNIFLDIDEWFRDEDETVTIEMAMAGFDRDDIEVEFLPDRSLTVRTKFRDAGEKDDRTFIKRGIAKRDFEKSFRISQHTEVKSCEMKNGLLVIELGRNVPEREKPKLLDIK